MYNDPNLLQKWTIWWDILELGSWFSWLMRLFFFIRILFLRIPQKFVTAYRFINFFVNNSMAYVSFCLQVRMLGMLTNAFLDFENLCSSSSIAISNSWSFLSLKFIVLKLSYWIWYWYSIKLLSLQVALFLLQSLADIIGPKGMCSDPNYLNWKKNWQINQNLIFPWVVII